MKVACLNLLITGASSLIKSYSNSLNFYFLKFKVLKYKIVFCISNTYLKYMYLKYCPSLLAFSVQLIKAIIIQVRQLTATRTLTMLSVVLILNAASPLD